MLRGYSGDHAGYDRPRTDLERLGLYVRRSRSFEGFGQRKLAWLANVSQSAVARLELGRGGGMATHRLVSIALALGRSFPLGVCPHEHRCAWQPIKDPPPMTERDKLRELIVERGLDRPRPPWERD